MSEYALSSRAPPESAAPRARRQPRIPWRRCRSCPVASGAAPRSSRRSRRWHRPQRHAWRSPGRCLGSHLSQGLSYRRAWPSATREGHHKFS
eukprot:scaffold81486_cov64-Phaeocystis_antarctica.AAC.2